VAGEYYSKVFTRVYGLETVSLRYFNVFGLRQDPLSQYAAVIPRFIQLALEGKPLEIHGDGLQSRDFTYVSNVVEANLQAATATGVSGEIINIACGQTHTVLDIADSLSKLMNRKLDYYHTPSRKGDVRRTLADISRAKVLLGYRDQDQVQFLIGLQKTVDYFGRRAHGN
jgi:UDP-glucose 4-epimerase